MKVHALVTYPFQCICIVGIVLIIGHVCVEVGIQLRSILRQHSFSASQKPVDLLSKIGQWDRIHICKFTRNHFRSFARRLGLRWSLIWGDVLNVHLKNNVNICRRKRIFNTLHCRRDSGHLLRQALQNRNRYP